MIEIDSLQKHPEQTLTFISEVFGDAQGRISSRIIIEDTNLVIKNLPLGGEDGLGSILGLMPMIKDGFALNLRNEDVPLHDTKRLLELTTPTSLSDILPELGFEFKRNIIKNDPSLSLYRHAMVVFAKLSALNRASSIDIGIGVDGVSFWPHRPNIEDIWNLMCEIEISTRSSILDTKLAVGKNAEMRALHFFALGRLVAERLK